MKFGSLGIAVAIWLTSTDLVCSQPVDPAARKFQACAPLGYTERLACLLRLTRGAPPSAEDLTAGAESQASDGWIYSETNSPVDYEPVTTATVTASGSSTKNVRLSIRCSNGRTDLLLSGEALTRPGADYTVTYAFDDGPRKPLFAATAPSGTGITIRSDLSSLLSALSSHGEITVRLLARQGEFIESRYALDKANFWDRMAARCKWPAPATSSN